MPLNCVVRVVHYACLLGVALFGLIQVLITFYLVKLV